MKKDNNQMSLFAAITYEYLFVISSMEVEKDIRSVRAKLHQLVGLSRNVLNSVPHISLYYFLHAGDGDTLMKRVLEALSGMKSFRVKLEGVAFFGRENNDRTMYIKVENSEQIQQLHLAMQKTFPYKKEKLNPHLTVARGIPAGKMELIEPSLSDFEYYGEFDCAQVTVLRRMLGNEGPYELVRIINLED